jgi:hypothetical protein
MIIEICAKCSDMCSIVGPDFEYDGYVPQGIGIDSGEDYVSFKLDTATGKIVDFPKLTDRQVLRAIEARDRLEGNIL